MKKLIILSFFTFLICFQAQSQVSLGIRTGGSSNFFSLPEEITNLTLKSLIGYHAGVVAEIPIGSRLAIQAEVVYTLRGSKIDLRYLSERKVLLKDDTVTYAVAYENRTTSLRYIDVPLLLKYKFRGRPIGGYILAGFNFGNGIGGQENLTILNADKQSFKKETLLLKQLNLDKADPINFGPDSDPNNDYLPNNNGWITGAGLSLDTDLLRFNLDLRYFLGASSIWNPNEKRSSLNYYTWTPSDPENFFIKNRSFQLSLTVLYPLGGGW